MTTIPRISEEIIENFNDVKDLLRGIPDKLISEKEMEILDKHDCLGVAMRGFEECIFDENYPHNDDVKNKCHGSLLNIFHVLRNRKKSKKKPPTEFSEQTIDFIFRLLEAKREEVHCRPTLWEMVRNTYQVVSLKGIEDIFIQKYMPKVLEITKEADTADYKDKAYGNKARAIDKLMDRCIIRDFEDIEHLSGPMVNYILTCFEKLTIEKIEHIRDILQHKGVKWKNHLDGAVQVLAKFQVIRPYKEIRWEEDEKDEEEYDEEEEDYMHDFWHHPYNKYKELLEKAFDYLCQNFVEMRVLNNEKIQRGLAEVILSAIRGDSRLLYNMIAYIPKNINNWKDAEMVILDILEAINKCLHKENFRLFEGRRDQRLVYKQVLESICPYIK